jgi:hypothetical protein
MAHLGSLAVSVIVNLDSQLSAAAAAAAFSCMHSACGWGRIGHGGGGGGFCCAARSMSRRPQEMVLLRLTMAAWMLPTNDHSFLEIMLGGAPYVPAAAQLAFSLEDLGRLMPADVHLGAKVVTQASVWSAVAGEFATPAGQAVLAKLGPQQRAYVQKLLHGNHASAPSPH